MEYSAGQHRQDRLDCGTRNLLHNNAALEREIGERNTPGEALQAHELDLRLLVDSIPAPVAVMTPSGEVETVNKASLEYFGKTLEDLKKWDSSDAVHPDDLFQAIEIWMEAIHTGKPYQVKERLRRYDGVYRWFEVRGFPLRGPDGRILNWCVLLTDIDDRQRAEEALRRGEAHLSQAQRLAHVGSWVWQVAGKRTVYLSEEWYRIYGFDPKGGMPTWEERLQRVHPEDRARWQAVIDRAIDEKSDYDLEFRILPPEMAARYVHSVAQPVLGSSGELVQFVGVSMDVTERKQADEAFRLIVVGTAATTGNDFFQSLVKHMAQALRARYAFVTTCDDHKHARTLAFWKGDGFGENFDFDIADTPCERVLHGEVCHYRQALQGLFPRDKFLADWQAESYLSVPMLDRSNRVIGHLAILDDKPMEADSRAIDLLKIFASRAAAELNRQKAEVELRAALQERERMREELAHLAHLNRVSTMGELAASLAHEIKQPISAAMTDARTCSRWLARDRPDLAEAQAAASRVVKDVIRASEIIGRVRSLFKKDSLQHEEVDINELIQEMIALLRGEASRHSILIHSDLSLDLPPIMADRVQLQQVLMNLMLNSIEAMKSMNMPGKLSIKSQQDDSGQLLISVMDTGVGVQPEKIEQIFNAFFTSKPQGTGMGLAISRSIIESHGGRLSAVSKSESGATFQFTLPIQRNAHLAVPLSTAMPGSAGAEH